MLSAIFLTAALSSAMSMHEEMGASAMHRYRRNYCIGLTVTVCVFSFGVERWQSAREPGLSSSDLS
ncbi:hypothetical protein ACFWRV_20460 [Streptomyces sp. NPDC058576]|uniref:hypothetical protein n=1 Tax=Streptomyces sp. NPDC058576 TaxID=3346547 RepID=UPI003667ACCD